MGNSYAGGRRARRGSASGAGAGEGRGVWAPPALTHPASLRCAHARPWGRLRAWVSAEALRGEFSAASRAVDSPGGGALGRDFLPSHCARGSR